MSEYSQLDVHHFQTEIDQILVILSTEEWLSTVEISSRLSQYGIGIHWKRIQSILEESKTLVQRKKSEKKWYYKVLKAGKDKISNSTSVLLIEPNKAVQGVSTIQNLLKNLKGTIKICDPYVDETIFQFLDACMPSAKVRILSKNSKNLSQIKLLISAHKTQGREIEFMYAATNVLHDRYIIDSKSMLILGTSFNGLGKKQCFVVAVGDDLRKMTENYFDELWAKATAP